MIPLPNGHTRLYGIIGNPVTHSFSPSMQSAAFAEMQVDALYLPFEIAPNDLPNLLKSMRVLGVKGFNVTVPYKEKILPFLDQLTPTALALGSVNTVLYQAGKWIGHSTDGLGFVRSLEEKGWPLKGRRVLLVGSGGSAKAIAFALAEAGIGALDIINRTQPKAEGLVAQINQSYPGLARLNFDKQAYSLLVNTTSAGMDGIQSPIELHLLDQFEQVADIIYNPVQTPLLKTAKGLGLDCINGLGMLLHQGTLAFEYWTGKKAPIDTMRRTLNAHLERS
ncbi:MAG: shikimate dehydrogenase [Candidatus Lambdaproteobacteria bacterium RIFOXYD2_FULL_50_16]|uniref:Shikimate dehydrogenase (NADP(+)) n=1 Tax=Candidatus Lambdaproteobacteria bacterium RIFOXYD2_FULL_50_16 TaxID=1817772 RepID=A0A1F6G9X2_9PROT|nr:MAG: shikimate dehydrogenase [Candidatus Lambdaproteobacteria bacterium RIFOXYD2_FULL_50_16]